MKRPRSRPRVGDQITLECSCAALVIAPIVIMLPEHLVVRIFVSGSTCHLGHRADDRILVWRQSEGIDSVYVGR